MEHLLRSFFYDHKAVRTVLLDGKPWFVAKDICDVLDISNPSDALKRLHADERARFNLGRQGETNIVNEAGLYALIIGSRKPEARNFTRWLTHEVIPAIRKYGAYLTDDLLDATVVDDEVLSRIAAQLRLERTKTRFLETKLQADLPKVIFADAVSASPSSILVGDLAKLIRQNGCDIGQNRLFAWMRATGYLMKRGASRNMPTQRAMNLGLLEIKETLHIDPDGHIAISIAPKVTGKGQRYFIDTFCGSTALH